MLFGETLRLAKRRGLEIIGIVTSRPERFRVARGEWARRLARRALVAAGSRDVPFRTIFAPAIDSDRLERRHGIPTLVPPGRDINGPEFVETLRRLRPDLALSYNCLGIFRRNLLDTVGQAVNYHAGLLPHYRGVMATAFSVLAGERESGFTFHRMTEKIDEGPILIEGSVAVGDDTGAELGRRKLAMASEALPRLFEKIAAKEPGRSPIGTGRYYSVHDWSALIHVDHPEDLTAAQLSRRIRAFGAVQLRIDGAVYPVTRLRAASGGHGLAFRTVDGRLLVPDRFEGLPRAVHAFADRWL
jgi:methionyl-tRNA formyltransferase